MFLYGPRSGKPGFKTVEVNDLVYLKLLSVIILSSKHFSSTVNNIPTIAKVKLFRVNDVIFIPAQLSWHSPNQNLFIQIKR